MNRLERHLDEDEFAAAVAGEETEDSVRQHLTECLVCHRQVAELRAAIEARRDELAGDSPDWEAQRTAVMERLGETAARLRRRRRLAPALAAAAAVLMAIGVSVIQFDRSPGAEVELGVEEILAEAEALLESDAIPGFEVIDPGLEELEDYFGNGLS
jgi:hypothetical protein